MKRRFLSLILGLMLTCCLAMFFAAGCGSGGQNEVKIVLDSEIASTVELGSSFIVPSAHLADKNGTVDGTVEIEVRNPNDIIVSTSAIEMDADIIGDYKITYSSAGVESASYVIKSQDTTGPVITANDVFYNLYKGEEVSLPSEIV